MDIVCIIGGSKSGKSYLEKALSEVGFKRSISYTTREINSGGHKGEKNGVDYTFITVEQFKELERKGIIIESENNYGNWYGTPKLYGSRRYVAVVGLSGARKLKEIYGKQVLCVMLKADESTLKERGKICSDDFDKSDEQKKRAADDNKQLIEMENEADIIIDSTIGIEKMVAVVLKELRDRRTER